MLMPLGGYKGSGLGLMVEILCAVLGGGAMASEVGGIRIHNRPNRCSQCFIAIDVVRFMPVEVFNARMEKLVDMMKSTPAAPGYDEVMVAGDPEWRTEAQRRQDGIPIAEGNWDVMAKTAARLKVALPTAP
jgi:LDH2 family malate/lactate/ureidoglycolate dehydrogenase